MFKLFFNDQSCLLSNSWLAGFIDAEGYFGIRYTEKKTDVAGKILTKQRYGLIFKLEQKQIEEKTQESFNDILTNICNVLGTTLKISKHNNKKYYCIEISSLKRFPVLINYLHKYNLMTSKKMDFND